MRPRTLGAALTGAAIAAAAVTLLGAWPTAKKQVNPQAACATCDARHKGMLRHHLPAATTTSTSGAKQ